MLAEVLKLINFDSIIIFLLGLLVAYILVMGFMKKYLGIVNKGLMLFTLFSLLFYISLIFTNSENQNSFSWIFTFLALYFSVSLIGVLADLKSFSFISIESLKLSGLIFFTYHLFDLIYEYSPYGSEDFGREGALLMVMIVFVQFYILSLVVIAIIASSSKIFLQIFVLMLGIFILFMLNEKLIHDRQEELKYKQSEFRS